MTETEFGLKLKFRIRSPSLNSFQKTPLPYSMKPLINVERHRREAQDEHHERDPAEPGVTFAEGTNHRV